MNTYGLLACAPMLAALCWSAALDLRARRIPNWLTLGLAASGVMFAFTSTALVSPTGALLGLLSGFGIAFVLFGLGGLCGGDVKLMAAAGAWLGPAATVKVFAAALIIGMVIAITQAMAQGRLRVLLRDSTVVAMSLAHASELGLAKAVETGQACAPSANAGAHSKRMLPFAVPMLLGTLLVLATL